MAIVGAELSTYEKSRYDNDDACVLPVNILSVNTVDDARWTIGGESTDTDYTTTGKQAFRAYDNIGNLGTRMTDVTDQVIYFNLKVTSGLSQFDTVVVYGHNFFLSGPQSLSVANYSNATIHLQASDDDFSVIKTLQTHTVSSNDLKANMRIVFNDFTVPGTSGSTPHTVTGVKYLRIAAVAGGTQDLPWNPILGEVFVGSRRGFKDSPTLPWSQYGDGAASNVTDFVSQSGSQSRYVFSKGQSNRKFKQALNAYSDFDQDLTLWRDWYRLSDQGVNPFVYFHKQKSVPEENWLMSNKDANLENPLSGFNFHEGLMSWTELPPFAMPERKTLDDS